MKRFLALLLAITLLLSLFPAVSASSAENAPRTYTDEDYAPIDELFDVLDEIEDSRPTRNGNALSESTTQAIIEKIEASDLYVKGSLQRDEYALTWKTTSGIACHKSLVEEEDRGESYGEPIVPPENGYEHISYAKRGQPNGTDVYLVGPYYGYDDRFTDHYKTVAKSIAAKTGGSYTLYSGKNATIDNVANAISNGAIVLIDSHGTYGSSKSYLRLKSGTGLTDADYNGNAYYDADTDHGEAWMVTGTAIVNHMKKEAPNSFVWFGICSGMRYNTMHRPIMNNGVEATFGYSRTISFQYDREWLSAFIDSINAGNTVATAAAAMKKSVGYWDHARESYYDTLSEAQDNGVAFPIFVSAEDSYPSSLQNYQTVKSTWKLADCKHTNLTAVAAKNATCTSDGNIAYYTCAHCKGYFTDANATSETTSDKVIVKAYGHSFVDGVCSRCGTTPSMTMWHFWPGSPEAKFSWVGENTSTGSTPPTITTTGRGTIQSISGGGDHYFHMLYGTGSMGHSVKSGDIIEIRYRTVKVPSAMLNKTGSLEFWYTTTDNDSTFASSMVYKTTATFQENTWQTVTFTPSTGITLKRIMFDFLEEDNGFSGTTIEVDYVYVGPSTAAPSTYKTNELWFDFANKSADQMRYSGPLYGDMNFDNGKWYVGSTLSSQSIDNSTGEFIGTVASNATAIQLRTGVDGTANEAQLTYKPGSKDYFQARFKLVDAEATAENLNIDFYFYNKTSNAWHSARVTANQSIIGNYYTASIPMAAVADYQNAGSISSVQLNISNFKSASGKTAKIYVDYIYVGETTPNPVAHDFVKTVTPPTCTTNGYTTNVCKLCGYTFESEVTDPLNHVNKRTETTQATCAQTGTVKVICNDCGVVLSTETIPAGNHAKTTTLRIDASCTEEGEITELCDLCGEIVKSEILPATGHSYKSSVTAPTCTNQGYTTQICACGDTKISNYVPALGHSYTSKVTTAPKCEAEGIRTFTCSCGDSYTEEIAATGHSYNSVLTQATCTTDGFTTYSCKNCNHVYQGNIIPAFGHAFKQDNNGDGTHKVTCANNCGYTDIENCTYTNGMCACGSNEVIVCQHPNVTTTTVAATCTEAGSKITLCDDCGETLISVALPASGHNAVKLEAIEATCTQNGTSAHWFCAACNTHFIDEECVYYLPESFFVIPALNHNVTYFSAKTATCTESGWLSHYRCENCNSFFFDAACEYYVTREYIMVDPTGHDTRLTNNGINHTISCSKCSYSINESHQFVQNLCVCGAVRVITPVYNPNLTFNMAITLGSEINVNYALFAGTVASYDKFYLEVKKASASGEETVIKYGIDAGYTQMSNTLYPTTGEIMMYKASYKGINAKEMGDSFSTTLYVVTNDGSIYYGPTVTTSIKDFLIEKFNAANATDALKTMVVDMLRYGAAAQIRLDYNTENLVTADLTESQLSYATQTAPKAVNYASSSAVGADITTSILVASKVQLGLSCITSNVADPSTVKCLIADKQGNVLAELSATSKYDIVYSAIYENVGAREMRKQITATFFADGMPISKTITWSVESYVAQTRAKTNVSIDELNMVNALLAYGDSVAAYLDATGQ